MDEHPDDDDDDDDNDTNIDCSTGGTLEESIPSHPIATWVKHSLGAFRG